MANLARIDALAGHLESVDILAVTPDTARLFGWTRKAFLAVCLESLELGLLLVQRNKAGVALRFDECLTADLVTVLAAALGLRGVE